jgi:hypothetical protein
VTSELLLPKTDSLLRHCDLLRTVLCTTQMCFRLCRLQMAMPQPATVRLCLTPAAAAAATLLCRLTTADRVMRLPSPVNHHTVFSYPLGCAAIAKALKELIG